MNEATAREDGDGVPPAASTWPGMRYGVLETMLAAISGGERDSVAARFRNLRQLPFPDAIRTGTGNRVEYDLPRVLAFSSVFALNALFVPQSHSVTLVRELWPELARGFVAAAVESGVIRPPKDMPRDTTAIVSVQPDAFGPKGTTLATAANLRETDVAMRGFGVIADQRLDCAKLLATMRPFVDDAGDADARALAFGDLDRSFGWSGGSVPHRGTVYDLFSGISFLDRGPYLERAAAFLAIADDLTADERNPAFRRDRSRRAAGNLLAYLGRPAPIDEWKGDIGTAENGPRLKHYLTAAGEAVGLRSQMRFPDVQLASCVTPVETARTLIERALRLESAKRGARGDAS